MRNRKLSPNPSCVPTSPESQSLVSISSESQRIKSIGLSIEVMRSQSGRRRTSRGIVAIVGTLAKSQMKSFPNVLHNV